MSEAVSKGIVFSPCFSSSSPLGSLCCIQRLSSWQGRRFAELVWVEVQRETGPKQLICCGWRKTPLKVCFFAIQFLSESSQNWEQVFIYWGNYFSIEHGVASVMFQDWCRKLVKSVGLAFTYLISFWSTWEGASPKLLSGAVLSSCRYCWALIQFNVRATSVSLLGVV